MTNVVLLVRDLFDDVDRARQIGNRCGDHREGGSIEGIGHEWEQPIPGCTLEESDQLLPGVLLDLYLQGVWGCSARNCLLWQAAISWTGALARKYNERMFYCPAAVS